MTTPTDLSELPQELSIAEKYNSERQNEAGAEEGDDVAVAGHVVGIPVQGQTNIYLHQVREKEGRLRRSTIQTGPLSLCELSEMHGRTKGNRRDPERIT